MLTEKMFWSGFRGLNQYISLYSCLILFIYIVQCAAETCVTDAQDKCKCHTSQYTIDLNPITSGHQSPLFKDLPATVHPDSYVYSLQPCLPAFTEGTCQDVASCQSSGDTHYSLGSHTSAAFSGDAALKSLVLTFNDGEDDRITHINLKCKSSVNSDLVVVGEAVPGSKEYNYTLTTKYACPPGGSGGLSTGSILVILLFVFALIYVLGGVLFLRFVRGARGIEQVPNHEFWSDFPLLVRDGVAFAMRGCKSDTVYEQI